MSTPQEAARWLQTPAAIRARCQNIFDAVAAGQSPRFTLQLSQLEAAADRVAAVTRAAYLSLRIPYHSRWNHFQAGGRDRRAELDARLASASPAERGRSQVALVITSVLLDAGAGPRWRYVEEGQTFSRSEGLAVASFRAFLGGGFSSTGALQADAAGLRAVDAEQVGRWLQVGPDNPLVGLEGRAGLLSALGAAVAARPDIFAVDGTPRVGGLLDHLRRQAVDGALPAATILAAVLDGLGSIWPGRESLAGVNLGDVWAHPCAGGEGPGAGLVPFHKLSQWLSYSLLEPLLAAGITVTGVDALTGLPEYRNGGLFIDGGVIVPRHPSLLQQPWPVSATEIVEWRALTVTLLDRIAPLVRARLALPALPLGQILEGGTWAAGRQIAAERRAGGRPPISIISDGTVF